MISTIWCTVLLLNFITDGEDYRVDSTTVSVAAGETSKAFTINIINDDTAECREIFMPTLNVPTPPCEVVSGKNNNTEVIIRDTDSKRIVST